jgi:hypothetical protein
MNLGTSSPASFDLSTNNLFVEAWVYFNNPLVAFQCVVADGPAGSGTDVECWFLSLDGISRPRFGVYGTVVTSSTTLTFSTWYHIAASYNSGTAYIFVNGGTPNSVSVSSSARSSSGASLTIGAYPSPDSAIYMSGYIQDLRVIKGGTVPTTSFTPVLPPFSNPLATLPYSLTGGTVAYTLRSQFITYIPGIYNQAINFPNSVSTGSYTVPATTSVTYNVTLNSTPGFTISLWVKFNIDSIFAQVVLSASGQNILYHDSNNKLAYYDSNGTIYFPNTVNKGTWYNPVIVVSGTTVTLYLNGNSSVGTTSFTTSNSLLIGSAQSNFPAWCSVQDLRIYNTPLIPQQINAIYANGGAPGNPLASTMTNSTDAVKVTTQFTGSPLLLKMSPEAQASVSGIFSLRAISAVNVKAVQVTRFLATGGDTVQDINGYRIHTFSTIGTSTFTPVAQGFVEVLVVAGGGSGGSRHAGGGGAGGLIYNSSFLVSAPVTVTVGDGGASISGAVQGINGNNSVFSTLVAIGGGGGGRDITQPAGNGGSGGGQFGTSPTGQGTTGQGNNGGLGSQPLILYGSNYGYGGESTYGGGGGGGAGAVGTNSTSSTGPGITAGAGGIGLQYSISGTPTYYAGGGGGGTTTSSGFGGSTGGAGGQGGGGAGGGYVNGLTNGQAGTDGTGGGGGGGGFTSGTNFASGKGGSGIVIVRYKLDTQDFYADRLGNLLTAPVIGQTLTGWLGGATGCVTTWYDQSGKGNDATQTITTRVPSITLDASNRYQVDFTTNGGSSWLTLPNGTIPVQTAYTMTCHHNQINNTNGGICGGGLENTNNSNKFRRNDTQYVNYWYNNNEVFVSSYITGNIITFKFLANTSITAGDTLGYINGSSVGSSNRSSWTAQPGNEVIGSTVNRVSSESMNGQMYSLFLFKSALSDSDRIAVENAS